MGQHHRWTVQHCADQRKCNAQITKEQASYRQEDERRAVSNELIELSGLKKAAQPLAHSIFGDSTTTRTCCVSGD